MKTMPRFFLLLALLSMPIASSILWAAPVNRKTLSLPIVFERNAGQAPPEFQFVSRHGQVETLFSATGVDFLTHAAGSRSSIHMRLLGVRPDVVPEGENVLPGVTNYLRGNNPSRWLRKVPNLSQIVYPQIYSGVDLIFRGTGDQMEHDFRVAAGSNPDVVHFAFDGAKGLALDGDGNLNISVGIDVKLIFERPVGYQESSRGREAVQVRFVLDPDSSVRFQVGAYDHERELVIDPVFRFSTYLAGSGSDIPTAVTTDTAGNVYVTGYTNSQDFPIVNGIQTAFNGSPDAFVSKFDPTGHTLLYSTYLGGSSRNYGSAIEIDSAGNIVVAGTSASNDFPHAGSVPSLTCQGNNDCFFIASLNPQGDAFNYAGLIGGIVGTDVAGAIGPSGVLALDPSGSAYLAGVTDDPHFEITPGTLASSVPGYPYNSTFVLKVDTSGKLVYSTIVPGSDQQSLTIYLDDVFIPNGVGVDSHGQVTIAGTAGPGLPSTNGVLQPSFPNNDSGGNASAGFVLQLNATASAINYATYIPGTDQIGGLAVDQSGDSYVTGQTSESNLPVSSNAYQKTLKSGPNCPCNSGFILELNGSGTQVLAATYLEGTPGFTSFAGIALDAHSNVFVGGTTGSTDFPLVNPFTSLWVYGGTSADMVLAEMTPDLSSLLFGSFLSSVDQFFPASQFSAIAVGASGDLVVVGSTDTTDFPTTSGSFQPVPPTQANHGFVARLDMSTPAPSVCFDSWSVNFGYVLVKTANTQTIHLTNCGNSSLHINSVVSSVAAVTAKNSCATIQAGGVCAISLVYIPQDTSSVNGTITFSDDAAISSQVISFSGQGVAPQLSPASGSVSFGHLLVNTKGAANPLFFLNVGTYPLTIKSASADGDFSVSADTCIGTFQVYNGCLLSVTFAPAGSGIRTGTLTIVSNDPVNPRAGISLVGIGDVIYQQPLISGLDSSTAQIQNGPTTVRVSGANFYPTSVVQANGIAQATTFISDVELQATLGGDVTAAIGEIKITVSNPTPGGGTSDAIPLTGFQVLNLSAAFLASAPGSKTVYASLPSWSPTNPNTVIPIDASTGTLGTPMAVGNDPGLLALSNDGKHLLVVANQDQTVQRISLATGLVEKTFSFAPNNCSYCGMQTAVDLKAVPGFPEQFVLALTGEVALYNDQGLVNYVPTNYSAFGDFTSFAYAGNPLSIYTLPVTNAQTNFFNVITVSPQGLGFTLPQVYGVNAATGAEVVSDGTLLYTSTGEVWNPATQTQTGSFPLAILNASGLPNLYSLLMDKGSGHIFAIGNQSYQSYLSSMTLSAFGTKSLGPTGALAFATIPPPYAQSLSRWGANGFAFIAQGPNSSSEAVYLLTSSLATPVGTNPVPKIRSLSPPSIPQGSSDIQLTLNGQGFTEASVVNWNGSPLQTTYVAGTVLSALVQTVDLVNSASITVIVANPAPGGGNSNSVSFTVAPLAPLISFSSSAVSFSVQKVGTTGPTRVISVQNPGTATLDIANIQIKGANASSFRERTDCGSSLSPGANCSVWVTFVPKAKGALSAAVTFTDDAAGSPQGISLKGVGD